MISAAAQVMCRSICMSRARRSSESISSAAMIEQARRRYPQLRFEVGDMRSLPGPAGEPAAVVAMYSLIHFDDSDLALALDEIRRVRHVSGGTLLAGLHRGGDTLHVDGLLGHPVDLDFRFFEPDTDHVGSGHGPASRSSASSSASPIPRPKPRPVGFYVIAATAIPAT